MCARANAARPATLERMLRQSVRQDALGVLKERDSARWWRHRPRGRVIPYQSPPGGPELPYELPTSSNTAARCCCFLRLPMLLLLLLLLVVPMLWCCGRKLPVVSAAGTHAHVGTDDPDAKEHFLIVFDTAKLDNMNGNPITSKTSYLKIKETYKGFNVSNCLRDLLPDKRPVSLKLGRPAVSATNGRVIVGTDDPDAKEHFLVALDCERMQTSHANPIATKTSYLKVKHVRDACWLRNGKVLVAVGDGLVQLYSVDQNSNIKCTVDGAADPIHTDIVRELVAAPFDTPHAVSCGFDKTVCYLDVSRATQREVRRYQLHEVVGSARWTAFKGANSITCTTDDGKFHAFDFRLNTGTAALQFNSGKQDMFAHEHYADHYILLGYADAEIRNYDLRATNKPLSVDCIGNIHYREAADPNDNSFIVTGMTDFSVWAARDGQAQKLWSHITAFRAAYLDDTHVLTTDSAGFAHIHIQEFQSDRP